MLLALDPDEHLIKVPLVTGPRAASTQAAGEGLAEFLAPTPHRLMGDDDAPFSQKQLDIPQAEAEHVIQPDSVADDLGGKAMAVMRVRRRLHVTSLGGLRQDGQTLL